MNRLEGPLTVWAILSGSRDRGGRRVSCPGRDGSVGAGRIGFMNRLSCSQWTAVSLAALVVLALPWGGVCERRTRPADPTTTRIAIRLAQESESRPGAQDPGYGGGLLEMYPDILDDADSEEELENRCFADRSQEFPPASSRAITPLGIDHRHDDSGRSARSSLLRC
jgi:hypothetical protein